MKTTNIDIIILISFFLIGDASMFILGGIAKNDFLLGIFIAVFISLIMGIMFARIKDIFPTYNLYEIIETCFGKYIGTFFNLLFTLFFFEVSSSMLVLFMDFIVTSTLINTPKLIINILVAIFTIYFIKKECIVMLKFSSFFFFISCVSLIIYSLLLTPKMNFQNLFPLFTTNIKIILGSAFSALSIPFGEVMIFTIFLSSFDIKTSAYKLYIYGILFAAFILSFISITNILVLGIDTGLKFFYPSYITSSKINITNVLQRVEILSLPIFIFGSFLKLCLYFSATCRGIAKLTHISEHKIIIVPLIIIAVNFSYFNFDGDTLSSNIYYHQTYPYISFLFQIVLPIIIYIIAEIKHKNRIYY